MPDKLRPDAPTPGDNDTLSSLRAQIDEVDEALQALFERRMALVEEIAAYKHAHAMPVLDPIREAEKLATVGERAAAGLASCDEAFFRQLMALSRQRQEELLKGENIP